MARHYFDGLHKALSEQYQACDCSACKKVRLNLADDPKTKKSFKELLKIAETAFKKLFEKGKYKPEDLFAVPEYQDLAKGTAELFSSAIPQETPQEMQTYLEQDAFIFSELKAHAELTEARSYLKDEKGNVTPYHKFEQKVLKLNEKYNKNYLEAEYEFAVHSSQSAANWANLQENTDRYWLEYRTAGDERVRQEHDALRGTCLPKNDPFWQEYYPPNGWRCRCVAVEVLAREKEKSNSKEAINKGRAATSKIGKNGKNKLAMFRFNPGLQKKMFPPKNSYKPKYCRGANLDVGRFIGLSEVFLSLENERCKALREIEEQARRNFETWEDVPTKKGQLKVSSKHGNKERSENIEIASYFTNKYGHKIRLLGVSNKKKTADVFNETLGIKQEYKRPTKATKNAIDNAIRDGKEQADHIVLDIILDFDNETLKRGIKGRVNQAKTVKSITLIKNGKDKTYTRDEILSIDFEL